MMIIFTYRRIAAITTLVAFAMGSCAISFRSCSVSSQNPKVDLTRDIHFYVYDAGRIIRTGSLHANSALTQRLDKLLRDAVGKWSKSYTTFAPGIVIRGDKFSITLQQRNLILNYAAD